MIPISWGYFFGAQRTQSPDSYRDTKNTTFEISAPKSPKGDLGTELNLKKKKKFS